MIAGAVSTTPVWRKRTTSSAPATASFWGETGLWLVQTAKWSTARMVVQLYRPSRFAQGQTMSRCRDLRRRAGPDGGAAGVPVVRASTGHSSLFSRRSTTDGGLVNDYPFVARTTGNDLAMCSGRDVNLLSEMKSPIAMALRERSRCRRPAMKGAGTGEFDYFADRGVAGNQTRVESPGWRRCFARPVAILPLRGLRWCGAAFGARPTFASGRGVWRVPVRQRVMAREE